MVRGDEFCELLGLLKDSHFLADKIVMAKTNKSFLKRIKITGTGKILKRPPGQNHFNAKDSGVSGQRKHGNVTAPREMRDKVKALIRF